jgi:hypothetical protein
LNKLGCFLHQEATAEEEAAAAVTGMAETTDNRETKKRWLTIVTAALIVIEIVRQRRNQITRTNIFNQPLVVNLRSIDRLYLRWQDGKEKAMVQTEPILFWLENLTS